MMVNRGQQAQVENEAIAQPMPNDVFASHFANLISGSKWHSPWRAIPSRADTDRLPLNIEQELARLVKSSGPRGAFYCVAALLGPRMCESTLLEWRDFDERGSICFRAEVSKSKRDDVVAIPAELVKLLKAMKPKGASPTSRIFLHKPTTRTLYNDLRRARIAIVDHEGRRIDRHSLRHTTATLLARAGVTPQQAPRQMRHADISITMKVYTRLALEDQARAVAKLPNILMGVA